MLIKMDRSVFPCGMNHSFLSCSMIWKIPGLGHYFLLEKEKKNSYFYSCYLQVIYWCYTEFVDISFPFTYVSECHQCYGNDLVLHGSLYWNSTYTWTDGVLGPGSLFSLPFYWLARRPSAQPIIRGMQKKKRGLPFISRKNPLPVRLGAAFWQKKMLDDWRSV